MKKLRLPLIVFSGIWGCACFLGIAMIGWNVIQDLTTHPTEIIVNNTSLPVWRTAKQVLQREGYILLTNTSEHIDFQKPRGSSEMYEMEFSTSEIGKTLVWVRYWTKNPRPFTFVYDSGSQMLNVPRSLYPTLENIKREAEAEGDRYGTVRIMNGRVAALDESLTASSNDN